jgi:hypothetical protein
VDINSILKNNMTSMEITNELDDFLSGLAGDKLTRDVFPFNTGDEKLVLDYIKKIGGRLNSIHTISAEADFSNYGSGYASFVNVFVSKRNGSGTVVETKVNKSKETLSVKTTTGLELYISKLCPYWFYGAASKSITTDKDGAFRSSSGGFLTPQSMKDVDRAVWNSDIENIKNVMLEYQYTLLTDEELSERVSPAVDSMIYTELSNPPFHVFDAFFHWED